MAAPTGPVARDWYTVLQLSPGAASEEIAAAVERLSRQATSLATTAPERSQQLRETIRAIKGDLLSGAQARQRYDEARTAAVFPAPPPLAPPAAPVPGTAAVPGPAPTAPWPVTPAPASPVPPLGPPGAAQPAGPGFGARIARFLRTGWTCPACGTDALPNDKFCKKCGSPIQPVAPDVPSAAQRPARIVCAGCGRTVSAGDAFCSHCGTRRPS